MSVVAALVCIGMHCVPSSIFVYDGDTFMIGPEHYRVRGINAPEIKGKCDAENTLAQKARIRLEDLLRYQKVEIKVDGIDRYNRNLAWVSVDNVDVGEEIMKDGLARRWTQKWDHQPEPWCLQ